MTFPRTARCQCGRVTIETRGAPIMSAICLCASCQAAGAAFERPPGAPSVLDPDGGTAYLLYRKDRAGCIAGADQLDEHRLTPESPTRRMVARCCNSPMFLEFQKGHWWSIYRDRFSADAPQPELRTMARDRREGVVLSTDIPNYETHSPRFMWRLLKAWIPMLLRPGQHIEGAVTL